MIRGRAEIGIGLQGDKSPGEYRALAALAEEVGIDVISVFADLWFQPAIGPLLEMAKATCRVRLGAACWNPYTSHPYELAGQAALLDAASAGRAYVGLARGSWLDTIGIDQRQPLDHLRDSAEIVARLLGGDVSGYTGRVFRLEPGHRLRYPLPEARLPLLFGAWGPRAAALAGELGDEVKIGGTANPAMVAVMRERLAVGEQRAGRAPGSVAITLGAVTVVARDGAEARRRARTEVAMYLPVVAALDPTVAVPGALIEQVRGLVDRGEHEAAGRLIPDDVLGLFAFCGTPDEVAQQAQAVIDAGAGRVEFGTPQGLTGSEGVHLLGEQVVPQLRREPPSGAAQATVGGAVGATASAG